MSNPANHRIDFPRVALRVGFAGTQDLAEERTSPLLEAKLKDVLSAMATRLIEIAPSVSSVKDPAPSRVTPFYSRVKAPLLRVVTGLCQGADALAGDVLEEVRLDDRFSEKLRTELAAVIPFDFVSYRESRPPDESVRKTFDDQAERCAYILALDSTYEKTVGEEQIAEERRARAYRAQGALLLRHADIIVAVARAGEAGKTGGTIETVYAAMEFGLPIVFIEATCACVTVIRPGDDPAEVLSGLKFKSKAMKDKMETDVETKKWTDDLRSWVSHIVADPEPAESQETLEKHEKPKRDYTVELLTEFFDEAEDLSDEESIAPAATATDPRPENFGDLLINHRFLAETIRILFLDVKRGVPSVSASRLARKTKSWGEFAWAKFAANCTPEVSSTKGIEPSGSYDVWRSRAKLLNYYYQNNYRGTFFINYVFAAAAVLLAAGSLLLLKFETGVASGIESLFGIAWGFEALLGILALGKLFLVSLIYLNTWLANQRAWNDRAVDYRYLAERLRSMCYLPLVGSFQPPSAMGRQNANLAVGQSGVDWLLGAIVRSVSPDELESLERITLSVAGKDLRLKLLRPDAARALHQVQHDWVGQQIVYHYRTALAQGKMVSILEELGSRLNKAVIVIVLIDIAITISVLMYGLDALAFVTPLLVFLAAVFPAAVASINGVRSQADCRRLSERSETMGVILGAGAYAREKKLDWFPEPSAQHEKTEKRLALPRLSKNRWLEAAHLSSDMRRAADHPATNPHSWVLPVLHYTESVAGIFVQEVAEWSVLYAKELPEL